jgi:hypothetical protein
MIRDRRTGSYTLAVRSTEFRDWVKGGDGERDKTAADIDSIAFTGFTLAQQDALERYYKWLKDNLLLVGGNGAKPVLNVTGCSLGGNLATVFTEMHKDDSDIAFGEAITFNGAGRGSWSASAGSEHDMLTYYRATLNDPRYDSALASAASGESAHRFGLAVVAVGSQLAGLAEG